MNIARDIIFWLEANSTYVAGTDLFLGMMPNTDTEGIVLAQAGGFENESNMVQTTLLINSIYTDYDSAVDNLQAVYNLLSHSGGLVTANYSFFNSVPIKYPGFVGRTPDGDYLGSCSIQLFFERT